ncbi:hypothetical protein BJY21_001492 [Kineosphaera limosa]|uniref:Putative hydrolase n=1 Tax=Kineosphaera limosa NBRC 100340 TaxID=1184609 RepID=K6XDI4_9MICO|nr:amidohydrolase [Kineosphaera limosa]NYE00308.1 hypothetical protein [Kineosphaera limosa]GAB96864.1 putative hydrolase [Kineosphaera limosa NBRC 100340]
MDVDLVLRGGRVHTVEESWPGRGELPGAVAVLADRIVAVGSDEELAGLRPRRVVDLDGACVVPGFGDAHNHMAWYGLALAEIDLVGLTSLEQLYALVAERAEGLEPGEMVVGSGYDDNLLGDHPDRDELDRVAGGRPVWLKHRSGHVAVVSTGLADTLRILDGSTPCPEGGVICTDEQGRVTGVLQEQAQNIVVAHVTPYPLGELAQAVARASRVYAGQGLTHVTECGIGRGWLGKSPSEAAAYQAAIDAGELAVRVQLMPCVDALHPLDGHPDDDLRFGIDLGLRSGFGGDDLSLGAMKIWLDGSLLACTAAMTQAYDKPGGEPANRGYLQDDADRMREAILAAHRGGWNVAAHAIGDAAVDLALETFAQAQRRWPRPSARHRVEHAGVTSPQQVRRFAELGVTPVPQLRFLHDIGDSMATNMGPQRAGMLYRQRSFLDAGCRVPGSSDRPVADGRPLAAMSSMMLRRTSGGQTIGPDEAVDAATALRAYTLDAAWMAGQEDRRGTITPGKLADLVVLADDPLTTDPERLADLPVLATLRGGLATHDTGLDLPQ